MSAKICANCGVTLQGDFCHACGQSVHGSSRYFGTILSELLDSLFSYDSRVYRTLIPLMCKPGYVCSEYLAGKRASYLPPFRLYLFASVIFFLFLPLVNDMSMSFTDDTADPKTMEQAEEGAAGPVELNIHESTFDEVDPDVQYFIEKWRLMREKISGFGVKEVEDLLDTTLNTFPSLMFFLLPLLALTLKLLYLFSKRYYMEHLIVVLYSQSFVFFMLLFANVFEHGHNLLVEKYPAAVLLHTFIAVLVSLAYLWIPLHVFLFMKRVYAQSNLMTFIKFSGMFIVYVGLIATAVALTIIWGILKI